MEHSTLRMILLSDDARRMAKRTQPSSQLEPPIKRQRCASSGNGGTKSPAVAFRARSATYAATTSKMSNYKPQASVKNQEYQVPLHELERQAELTLATFQFQKKQQELNSENERLREHLAEMNLQQVLLVNSFWTMQKIFGNLLATDSTNNRMTSHLSSGSCSNFFQEHCKVQPVADQFGSSRGGFSNNTGVVKSILKDMLSR